MSKQLLVGLTGLAGSGKDTVAWQTGFQIYAFASPIKRGIEAMFGLPASIWNDRDTKEAVIPWLGKSPRQLAQTLGTEWGRNCVAPDLWVRLAMRRWDQVRMSLNPCMLISDVRFDNEATAIIAAGGTVWRVLREVPPVATHISEKGVSAALIEGNIRNYGSLDDLKRSAEEWTRLLRKRYAK